MKTWTARTKVRYVTTIYTCYVQLWPSQSITANKTRVTSQQQQDIQPKKPVNCVRRVRVVVVDWMWTYFWGKVTKTGSFAHPSESFSFSFLASGFVWMGTHFYLFFTSFHSQLRENRDTTNKKITTLFSGDRDSWLVDLPVKKGYWVLLRSCERV